MNRRKFIGSISAGLASSVASAAGYGYYEAHSPDVSTKIIKLPKKEILRDFRILHLSDLHASPAVSYSYLEASIEKALRTEPDIICLTGDYITKSLVDFDRYKYILSKLARKAPTFAVPGNHDGGGWAKRAGGYANLEVIQRLMKECEIEFLYNQNRRIQIGSQSIVLVGLGDWWAGEASPATAFNGIGDGGKVPIILLSHNPDSKDDAGKFPWDLMLCGHTHGGQIVVPVIGLRPFININDPRYMEGLNGWRGKQIYTTRGIGNLHGFRFNCPPEISVLDIPMTSSAA